MCSKHVVFGKILSGLEVRRARARCFGPVGEALRRCAQVLRAMELNPCGREDRPIKKVVILDCGEVEPEEAAAATGAAAAPALAEAPEEAEAAAPAGAASVAPARAAAAAPAEEAADDGDGDEEEQEAAPEDLASMSERQKKLHALRAKLVRGSLLGCRVACSPCPWQAQARKANRRETAQEHRDFNSGKKKRCGRPLKTGAERR